EGTWVGAGDPILYVSGRLFHLVDLETVLLQKLGPACVAAYNAYAMCADLPKVAFLAMDARHCTGAEMAAMMAYAAAVGSALAERDAGGGCGGFCGLRRGCASRVFRAEKGPRQDAPRADRLCRLDGPRGRDVPRSFPGRADDGVDRLFRPRAVGCRRSGAPLPGSG